MSNVCTASIKPTPGPKKAQNINMIPCPCTCQCQLSQSSVGPTFLLIDFGLQWHLVCIFANLKTDSLDAFATIAFDNPLMFTKSLTSFSTICY